MHEIFSTFRIFSYILLVEFNHFAVVLISGLDRSTLVGTFVIRVKIIL